MPILVASANPVPRFISRPRGDSASGFVVIQARTWEEHLLSSVKQAARDAKCDGKRVIPLDEFKPSGWSEQSIIVMAQDATLTEQTANLLLDGKANLIIMSARIYEGAHKAIIIPKSGKYIVATMPNNIEVSNSNIVKACVCNTEAQLANALKTSRAA